VCKHETGLNQNARMESGDAKTEVVLLGSAYAQK